MGGKRGRDKERAIKSIPPLTHSEREGEGERTKAQEKDGGGGSVPLDNASASAIIRRLVPILSCDVLFRNLICVFKI